MMRLKSRKAQKGQATIEYAFAALFFFAFLLFITDMVHIGYSWVTLQFAVNEGARYASLGQSGGNRSSEIEAKVIEVASGLGVNDVSVNFINDSISISEVEASTTINLNPLSDVILNFGGNYNRTYQIVANTAVRNEAFF